MGILTPTIAVTIIWALFLILTITITGRSYAIRIHERRKAQLRSHRPDRNLLSHTPRNGIFSSKVVLTTCLIALQILALLYCAAATLSVIAGYDFAEKRRALIIRYGGAENGIAAELLGGGELGKQRWYLQKVGVAMELGYVVIAWTLKCGLVAVGWQVGKGLGLWGVGSRADAATEKGIDAERGDRKMDSKTKRRVSLANAVLYTLGFGIAISFLGVIVFQAIEIGMTLSRTEVEDITSRGLRKELVDRRQASIACAIGSLGTYLIAILLSIILLWISPSPYQPDGPRSQLFRHGGIFILTLTILTTAASGVRTAFILKDTTSIRPVVGDLITGGILIGKATGSTYDKALGLTEKVFAVLEMMFGGIALCVPGMRVLFDSGLRRGHGKKRIRHDLRGNPEEDTRRLQGTSVHPSPATSEESTFQPPETYPPPRRVIAPMTEQQGNGIQNQEMGYNASVGPYETMTLMHGGSSDAGEAIGTRAIVRDRSRSRSRSGSRGRGQHQRKKQRYQHEQEEASYTSQPRTVARNLTQSASAAVPPPPPPPPPARLQQPRGGVNLDRSLPPLPLASEWERARDRELREMIARRV